MVITGKEQTKYTFGSVLIDHHAGCHATTEVQKKDSNKKNKTKT
jgi:hypothetical protein